MFRLLIIISLVVYVIYKVGSLFFRAGAASQQLRDQQRRAFDANSANANGPTKKTDKGNSKSGEYIDYEEVK
jgi:hypothetical protein